MATNDDGGNGGVEKRQLPKHSMLKYTNFCCFSNVLAERGGGGEKDGEREGQLMFIRFCVCRRERERERKRRGGKERGEAGNVFMNKLYDKFLIESNEKNNGKTTTTITVDKGESKTSHSEPARSKQGKKIESKSYTTTTTTTSGERQNSVHVSLATDQFIHIL